VQAALDLIRGFVVQNPLHPRFALPDKLASKEHHARELLSNLDAQASGLLDGIQSLRHAIAGIPAQAFGQHHVLLQSLLDLAA
jgi:hypothetical protein